MAIHFSINCNGLSAKAGRYDHPDQVCGSYVEIEFSRSSGGQESRLSMRADEARALATAMLAAADAIDAMPWEETEYGKAWAAQQPPPLQPTKE